MKQIIINQIWPFCTIILLLLSGCNSGAPRPINYGEDPCHYCKMTVVDPIHGAELITAKGRIYTFDALECLINYTKDTGVEAGDRALTNVFEDPGALVDVEQAVFLISKNLPSPMGANLTAFKTMKEAEAAQKEKSGIIYTWEALLEQSHKPVYP